MNIPHAENAKKESVTNSMSYQQGQIELSIVDAVEEGETECCLPHIPFAKLREIHLKSLLAAGYELSAHPTNKGLLISWSNS